MRNSTRLERLKHLKTMLLQIAARGGDKFNMGTFGSTNLADDPNCRIPERGTEPQRRCVTAACALGSAGLKPWFIARGLRTVFDGYSLSLDVTYRGFRNFQAGAEFFGLERQESNIIFNGSNLTAAAVADQVQGIIAHYQGVSHA